MTKKPKEEKAPDFGNRPELAIEGQNTDLETLSHNWQPDSPGVDMRDASKPLVNQENLVSKLNAQKDEKETAKKPEALHPDEYDRRTKLDVSDPKYVNPSLDHHTVKNK